jgi:hypothetical protein
MNDLKPLPVVLLHGLIGSFDDPLPRLHFTSELFRLN